jgi:NAD(P)H-binding
MENHGVRRLAVAGTAAVDPAYRASDSVIFSRVMEPLFMRLPGKTLYADNLQMEALVRASSLAWTIVRACWLFNASAVSEYQVIQDSINGMFTARADFAACLLAQLADDQYVGKTIGVLTTSGTPSLFGQLWHEVIRPQA